jgi:hypothetical protein
MRALPLALLVVCGCSRTPDATTTAKAPPSAAAEPTTESATQPATQPPAESCASLFAPPPSSKKLCDEHVMSTDGTEIHWQSYGHADDRYALWKPYHRLATKCGAGMTFKPPLLDVSMKDKRLELFDTNGGGYPTCSVQPGSEHKSVIIVSQKHSRGVPSPPP